MNTNKLKAIRKGWSIMSDILTVIFLGSFFMMEGLSVKMEFVLKFVLLVGLLMIINLCSIYIDKNKSDLNPNQ